MEIMNASLLLTFWTDIWFLGWLWFVLSASGQNLFCTWSDYSGPLALAFHAGCRLLCSSFGGWCWLPAGQFPKARPPPQLLMQPTPPTQAAAAARGLVLTWGSCFRPLPTTRRLHLRQPETAGRELEPTPRMWHHIWHHNVISYCDIIYEHTMISHVISWCDVEKWIWYHIWCASFLPMISHVISQYFSMISHNCDITLWYHNVTSHVIWIYITWYTCMTSCYDIIV